MKLKGTYKTTDSYIIGVIPLLDLREVGKSKKELFDKLTNRIKILFNEISNEEILCEIIIDDLNNSDFEIYSTDLNLFSSLLIKSLRYIEKETQEKIATRLKMSRTSYKQYEEGKREPSISKFNELINALGYEWELTLKRKVKK
ncbi:helix-turn-helix domain-containing protein [Silvanigrella sp.]|jgi:DNA-binding XRE family transcriptional regulator|uniref:helix-turn-helix domain-containing protein n=1 Tax=Silvanigrella sp. TaxID=2024976 RepID=UPI0037C92E36